MAASDFLTVYGDVKAALGEFTGASEDLLHVHAGLAIFVLAALLLKQRMRSPIPLALVVLFALGNELVDVMANAPSSQTEHVLDIANTLVWPAILFIVARRWR